MEPIQTETSTGSRIRRNVSQFMTGGGLPVFLVTVTLLYEAFLLAVLFAPDGSGPWSGFAVEFKVWCFNYDPRTGGMEWAAVWMMLLEPLFITGMMLLIWRKGLPALFSFSGWFAYRKTVGAGVATAIAALGALYVLGLPGEEPETALPFPGERIRTRLTPPPFALNDQMGNPVVLEDMRGQVVLITGVYGHCTTACPQILIELRTLLDDLPAGVSEQLSVIALSLNPEKDTRELMQAVASAYNFEYPGFRFINGDPEVMRPLLSRYHFSATPNPKTGQIDHANLFILIDAEGYIAYRFNLDPRHAPWLREAVISLTVEAESTALVAER